MKHLVVIYILFLIGCADSYPTNKYSYSPTTIKHKGIYYSYFCSSPVDKGIDIIRMQWSKDDGNTWSTPEIALTPNDIDRSACDPSIVYLNGYFYLFYSGWAKNIQTVNFVSRSKTPMGPFLKLTPNGEWKDRPAESQIIIYPKNFSNDGPGAMYGAGQPTVVNKNGVLYQWYNDYTEPSGIQLLLTTSTDAVNWTPTIITNATETSVDIKWDENGFVMFAIENVHSHDAFLVYRKSLDGIIWDKPVIVQDKGVFPKWSNNIAASGDEFGHLLNKVIIGFGAPYNHDPSFDNDCSISPVPLCWGYWQLDRLTFKIKDIIK